MIHSCLDFVHVFVSAFYPPHHHHLSFHLSPFLSLCRLASVLSFILVSFSITYFFLYFVPFSFLLLSLSFFVALSLLSLVITMAFLLFTSFILSFSSSILLSFSHFPTHPCILTHIHTLNLLLRSTLFSDKFAGIATGLLSLSTIMSVLVVNCHYQGAKGRPPPPWIQTYVLRYLKPILLLQVGGIARF